MIRFSWLQFRTQAMAAFGALAVVAVVLAVTGPHLVDLYNTTVATCSGHNDCATATTALKDTDGPIQAITGILLLAIPGLMGMFWGAPLVAREFETGTFRLVWNQGVTRTRWLAAKLGLGAATSMVFAGALSVMVTWWSSPIDRVNASPFNSLSFGIRDIVPVGYAAFAFVLGLTAGLLTRRMLPAIATALVGFVVAREVMTLWVRPHLIAPLHRNLAINASSVLEINQTPSGITAVVPLRGVSIPNAWVYSAQLADKAGHVPTAAFLGSACPLTSGSPNFPAPNLRTCIPNLAAKFREVITYQPTSHYWAFQWYETALFLGFAVILGAVCFWLIRRPIS